MKKGNGKVKRLSISYMNVGEYVTFGHASGPIEFEGLIRRAAYEGLIEFMHANPTWIKSADDVVYREEIKGVETKKSEQATLLF